MPKPPTESQKKPAKKKYVSPAVVDYGSVTKITASPKAVSSPDHPSTTKGNCL